MNSVYTLTQEQTRQAVEVAIKANTPVLITSIGGAGKSTIVKQIAEKYNLELIDIRLGQLTKFDLLGYPDVHTSNVTTFKPIDLIPTINTVLPPNKDGFLLFMDELLQADKYVQGASFRLIMDRQLGSIPLHPKTVIVSASNGVLYSGADNKMIAPLKSRFTHINMVVDPKEFTQYVENQVMNGYWNPLILGFINYRPEHINNFDLKTINDVTTYSCPRTLEILSKQINNDLLQLPTEVYENAIVGIIGESAGNDFNNYLAVYHQLPTVQEIIHDPDNCPLPFDVGAQWALSTLILQGITPQTTNQFARYIERVTHDDVKVVIYRTIIRKCPQIAQEPLVQKSMGLLKMKLNQIKGN